ncbi:MAG: hypothetical protein EZS28_020086, partial [Streblomastix strix]
IKQLQQQIAQLESKSTTSPGYIVDLWAEFTPIDQISFQQQKDIQQKLVPCFFVRPGTVDGGIATSPLSLSLPHNSFFIRVRSNDTSQSLGTRILRMIGGWLRFSSLIRTFIHMRLKSGNELLPLSLFGEDSDQFYEQCDSLLIEMAEREAKPLPYNITTNPSPSTLLINGHGNPQIPPPLIIDSKSGIGSGNGALHISPRDPIREKSPSLLTESTDALTGKKKVAPVAKPVKINGQ